jgi:hypothetical protein
VGEGKKIDGGVGREKEEKEKGKREFPNKFC